MNCIRSLSSYLFLQSMKKLNEPNLLKLIFLMDMITTNRISRLINNRKNNHNFEKHDTNTISKKYCK